MGENPYISKYYGYLKIEKNSEKMLLSRFRDEDIDCITVRNKLLEVTKLACSYIGNIEKQEERNNLLKIQKELYQKLDTIAIYQPHDINYFINS